MTRNSLTLHHQIRFGENIESSVQRVKFTGRDEPLGEKAADDVE